MVGRHQGAALLDLVKGRLPANIENFVAWADEFFWLTMAVKAPFHVEGAGFPHQRHIGDGAVTGRAANTLGDVNAVIEKDEIGQFVDPIPTKRNIRGQALPDGSEQRRGGK
jgi:hypothetical protein